MNKKFFDKKPDFKRDDVIFDSLINFKGEFDEMFKSCGLSLIIESNELFKYTVSIYSNNLVSNLYKIIEIIFSDVKNDIKIVALQTEPIIDVSINKYDFENWLIEFCKNERFKLIVSNLNRVNNTKQTI